MIYNVGTSQAVGTVSGAEGSELIPIPIPAVRWRAVLNHRTGGVKAEWIMGQNIPLVSVNFELNLHGCGAGDFALAWVDVPIDADDYLVVYYQDEPVYQGVINATPDPKGGKIDLIPRTQRAEELLYSGTFTGQTIAEILETIVTNATVSTDTGWIWDASQIDTGSSAVFTVTYDNETLKDILDKLVSQAPGCYWGVNAGNVFFFKPLESNITAALYQCDQAAFGKVESKINYDGVKFTRYSVYRKSTGASGTSYAGQVGFGGSYPTLAVEKTARKRVGKITVSDTLTTDAAALVYAYALLQTYQPYNSITVDDVILDRYFPEVFKKILVEDSEDLTLKTIEACDAVTDWTGATLESTEFVSGTGAVYFSSALINASMIWTAALYSSVPLRFKGMKKLAFMAWSTLPGTFISVTVNHLLPSAVTYDISIPVGGKWTMINLPYAGNIETVKFWYSTAPLSTNKLIIDRIQAYCYNKQQYSENIVQINYSIDPGREHVSMRLREYDQSLYERQFDLERMTKSIESSLVG